MMQPAMEADLLSLWQCLVQLVCVYI